MKIKSHLLLATTVLSFALTGPLVLTSCASTPHHESTGQFIDSSALTVKVKSQLLSEMGDKSLAITVNTYNNVVQLSGFVDNQEQKDRAVKIARNIPGVKEVRVALVIK